MALSGSIGNTFRTGYRLQIDWTATQNISANTSTVTAKMYLISLGSSYTINSSATKDGANIIDGTTFTFSGAGLADLNGNQKKLLATDSKTITHDTDGTKTFQLDGYFDLEVTLGGTFYGRIDLSATNFTLDTIPRKSALTDTTPAWTAGSQATFGISRASSSFTHKIEVFVPASSGTPIYATGTTIGTAHTTTFDTTDQTAIFNELNGAASTTDCKVRLTTYSGAAVIGSTDYTATITAPNASTITIANPAGESATAGQEDSTVYIDQIINLTINRNNSAFTHTIVITAGAFTKTLTGVGASTTWDPDSTEEASLYATTPNANEIDGNMAITTFYNGEQVRSTVNVDINFRVRNSNPTFGTGFTYKDDNTTTTTITGNNQYIIQNKSTVLVEIPVAARAIAVNGATMVSYDVKLDGRTINATWSNSAIVSADFNQLVANSNISLVIDAIDSRGNRTSQSKTVTILPYTAPVITPIAARVNGFEDNTTIDASGSVKSLLVAGVEKNIVGTAEYRYKAQTSGVFSSWLPFTKSVTGLTYTCTDVTLVLANTSAYDVEFRISDAFGVTGATTIAKVVPVGQPILFIDATLKSVGVGKFPTGTGTFETQGAATIGGNLGVTGNISGVAFDITGIATMTRTNPALIWSDTDPSYTNIYAITAYQNKLEFRIGANSTANKVFTVNSTTGINFNSNLAYTATATLGQAAMDLNNSDIIGVNGIHLADYAQTAGEGLMFPHTGAPTDSTDKADYDGFRILDGKIFVDRNGVTSTSGVTISAGGSLIADADLQANSGSMSAILGYNGTIARIRMGGSGATGFSIHNFDTPIWTILTNGNVTMQGRLTSLPTYDNTNASAANMFISSGGLMYRSTSSIKYKEQVEDLWETEYDKVLDLRPVWYRSKCEDDRPDWSYIGLIAEETAQVEPRLVHFKNWYQDIYNEKGEVVDKRPLEESELEPEGVQYDRIGVMLIPIVKKLRDRVNQLEEIINGTAS